MTKINPGKCKAVRFTRASVKDRVNYLRGGQRIPEASSCKHLGITLSSDLSWASSLITQNKKPGRHFISKREFSKKDIIVQNV